MGQRQGLWITLALFAIVAVAFGAGYGLYPLLHSAAPVAASAAPGEGRDLTLLWEAWGLLDGNFYGERPDDAERLRGAVRGMVDSFDDPYTVYVEPQPRELERDRLRGSFGGIGATVELTGTRILLHPLPDQPAARAGILEGDELRAVDGVTVTTQMGSDAIIALVRGPVDSTVNLAIRRNAESADRTIPVTRAEIQTPSIEARLLDDDPRTASIGYLRHTIFSERSADEMRAAIDTLAAQGADRFLWDVRGNPGGLVDAAIATADLWLDSGTLLIEEHADGTRKLLSAQPGGAGVDFPLVVLVDGASASASEIVAGALQDNHRARLVGERTFGKGSVQLIYELSDASSLHITNAQWFTPARRQISGDGLTPDIAVEPGLDPLPAAIDAVLAQGVRVDAPLESAESP